MANLLKRLAGPYFEFLVGPQGEWWERCHPKRRTMALKKSCFHNPDAVKVSMAVMELAANCFAISHPRFNYYGPTEYTGENLNALITCFAARVDALRTCRCNSEFDVLTPDIFIQTCKERLPRRCQHWRYLRTQAVDCLDEALLYAANAGKSGMAMLVLGV